MDKKFLVEIEVVDVLGPCPHYKKGDKILIDEPNVIVSKTNNFCTRAFPMLSTFVMAFSHGIETGLQGVPLLVKCPATAEGPVIFKVSKIPKEKKNERIR
ncbi:MAG: TIGR04076 family protein [Candidatus Baldrarchaeia archaeon]